MDPAPLAISRLKRTTALRLMMAAMVVVGWLGLIVLDLIVSFMMFFSEPHTAEIALYASPMLLLVPWILAMGMARGTVRVRPDALEIRHRRVLRRPLVVPRTQVRRVLIDDGSATGRARFPTGDEHAPLLWTDQVVTRQHADRPIIGDGILPNVAILLDPPLAMDAARDPVTAVPVSCEIRPPRRGEARALLLAMDDLEAVQAAFAGWPVERPDAARFVPGEVAAAAARVPADAGVLMALALVFAVLLTAEQWVLLVGWAALSVVFVKTMVDRRQKAAAEARAEVERRAGALSPADRATALAAIDANLGRSPATSASQGPPGW